METAILLFKQYSGHGMIMTLFLLSLGYLWFTEKNRVKRQLLIGLSVGVLALFFCPIVVWGLEWLSEEEVFWRMLWSLPMLSVISYTAVVLVRKLEGFRRYFAILGTVVIIMISGDYLYNNPGFQVAQNVEHVPQDVKDICDEMIVEGREVMSCFPSEMLMYVTQYTPYVRMPYGREMFLKPDGIVMWNPLYELMESEKIDAEKLSVELKNNLCHFVVLRKTTQLEGDLERFGWNVFYQTESYIVYLDENNDPR